MNKKEWIRILKALQSITYSIGIFSSTLVFFASYYFFPDIQRMIFFGMIAIMLGIEQRNL